jgi:hypothetical protein
LPFFRKNHGSGFVFRWFGGTGSFRLTQNQQKKSRTSL